MKVEQIILTNLVKNEDYTRKVLPFLKHEYFSDAAERTTFKAASNFFLKYNRLPTLESLAIDIDGMANVSEDEYKEVGELLSNIKESDSEQNGDWLIERTEKFCQDKAIYLAIMESIAIMDGDKKNTKTKDAIPQILSEALAVNFDNSVGHDFIDDSSERYESYHKKELKIPFDLEYMNKITEGGFSKKTLNVFMGAIGSGKSLVMCHMAAANLSMGKNVLYITMELAEERVAERIDANLMNITLPELKTLPKDVYSKKMERIKTKTQGKLIIKEYPTATAGAANFRYLIDELNLKKSFVPDIIYIDYLNICCSSRFKAMGGSINSYSYIKSIAEELRGLAVEKNTTIVSATQVNREGLEASDMDMTNTSECILSSEKVTLRDGRLIRIDEVQFGDQILANDNYKTVTKVHHKKHKMCYKITLKSGKTITVSEDHVFPTDKGRLSIKTGICVGTKMNSK